MAKVAGPDPGYAAGYIYLDGLRNILLKWNDDTQALEVWKDTTLMLQIKANSLVLPDAPTDGSYQEFGSIAKDTTTGYIVITDAGGKRPL